MTALFRLIARAVAIAIVIAALADPVWTVSRPPTQPLVVVDLTSEGSPSIDRSREGADVIVRVPEGARLPCAANERCVVIADGSRDIELPSDLTEPLSLIVDRHAAAPNVELQQVLASPARAAAAASLRVRLSRTGAIGATDIRVIDSGAVVGAATYKWQNETTAMLDVSWWPLAAGARALRVEADPAAGEVSATDNQIDVAVDVSDSRAAVVVFDARPSWSSTFVRRALEDDPRFIVAHRARIAPALTAGTVKSGLDERVLDVAEVLVVGGPDALTAPEVALIDRFVRVRGGTLLLLPEQRVVGLAARLWPFGDWSEHLTQAPERVGPLYATEILRGTAPLLSTVIARSGSESAIVSTPSGRGLVVISGAMDAWRHRDKDAGAFDRFWRSLVAQGAAAAAAPVLTIEEPLTQRGATTSFVLSDRRMTTVDSSEASATIRCADGRATALRLWPSGSTDAFIGDVSAPAGPCIIEAKINARRVTASFAVAERPQRGVQAVLTKLERVTRESGGAVVNAADAASLPRAIAQRRQPSSQLVSVRPMREPWWIIPFAGGLAIEWWLRRREGLR